MLNNVQIFMAFKITPIRHLPPSINNHSNNNNNNSNNNNYRRLPIPCTIIHRQTVFQQLHRPLLSILKMILFLFLICNISLYHQFFSTPQTNNSVRSFSLSLSSGHHLDPRLSREKPHTYTYIKFRYFP